MLTIIDILFSSDGLYFSGEKKLKHFMYDLSYSDSLGQAVAWFIYSSDYIFSSTSLVSSTKQ